MAAKTRRRPRPAVAESAARYSSHRYLLDTHVWLWWQGRDRRLGRNARALIAQAGEVVFSAASAWEIAIKRGRGKLDLPANADLPGELEHEGFTELPISIAHADAVRQLPVIHRDPFDRMLVAQAQLEGLTLITADTVLSRYGVPVVDARE